jgi:hypothetical protein
MGSAQYIFITYLTLIDYLVDYVLLNFLPDYR